MGRAWALYPAAAAWASVVAVDAAAVLGILVQGWVGLTLVGYAAAAGAFLVAIGVGLAAGLVARRDPRPGRAAAVGAVAGLHAGAMMLACAIMLAALPGEARRAPLGLAMTPGLLVLLVPSTALGAGVGAVRRRRPPPLPNRYVQARAKRPTHELPPLPLPDPNPAHVEEFPVPQEAWRRVFTQPPPTKAPPPPPPEPPRDAPFPDEPGGLFGPASAPMRPVVRCRACGAPDPDGAACPACGAPLAAATSPAPAPSRPPPTL